MQPLIDGDVLIYEVGFGVMTGWEGDDPPPFEMAREMLENKIANICALVEATKPPKIYLTGSGNFREKIATLKPYKGNRQQPKPFHYNNLRAYMIGVLGAILVEGMEADDAMAIEQTLYEDAYYSMVLSGKSEGCVQTIICSRDKDLKQVPGWHYTWECGKQPSWGPFLVQGFGEIYLDDKRKLKGFGDKFFLAQCIMGDSIDNIGGIPGSKDVAAYELLKDVSDYNDGVQVVKNAYQEYYGDKLWYEIFCENATLLWMCREIWGGKPVMWEDMV